MDERSSQGLGGHGVPSADSVRRLQRLRRRRLYRGPRYKGPSFNRLIPNIMTLLGLCAGLTAIRFALEGRFDASVIAVVIAACIDGLDGRLARLLKATSRFGAEFDSLTDFLCFGVAPAFILYLWSLDRLRGFGFTPCLIFAVCMALRLARFNAALDNTPGPPFAHHFFTGVPAPAGAMVVLFPLFLGLEARSIGWDWLLSLAQFPLLCAAMLIGTAILLVSTLPVWSFKHVKVPTDYVLPLLLGIGTFTALLVADPWAAGAAAGLLYLSLLPFSLRSYRRFAQAMQDRAMQDGAMQDQTVTGWSPQEEADETGDESHPE